jgi:hypothetical protein
LSERLEDQLAGNFFGTIRYFPFYMVLKKVLMKAQFHDNQIQDCWDTFLFNSFESKAAFEFWPRHEDGEIDLIIRVGKSIIGIEVKLYSGLSSVDDEEITFDAEESRNQLVRYSRLLSGLEEGTDKFLIFLAPMDTMKEVERSMKDRKIVSLPVPLGFLSWQEVLESLTKLDTSFFDEYQSMIIDDLKRLLTRKGFTRFRGFHLEQHTEIIGGSYTFNKNNVKKTFEWPLQNMIGEYTYAYKK